MKINVKIEGQDCETSAMLEKLYKFFNENAPDAYVSVESVKETGRHSEGRKSNTLSERVIVL